MHNSEHVAVQENKISQLRSVSVIKIKNDLDQFNLFIHVEGVIEGKEHVRYIDKMA